MKRKHIVAIILFAGVFLLTACGDKKDETTATESATPTVAETSDGAVSGSAVSGEAVSGEAAAVSEEPEPTEEPEVAKTYEVGPISELLKKCIGIRDTAGDTIKYAKAANAFLGYAIEEDLSRQNDGSIDNFKMSFAKAYDELSKKQKKELDYNLREEIMPMVMDSFQDRSLYMSDFIDAGVDSEWKKSLSEPNVRECWSVMWEAYEGAV